MFYPSDISKDDGLSLEEWSAMVKKKFPQVAEQDLAEEFKRADANSDGKVSLKEFKAYVQEILAQADTDQDNDISQ